ncbi:hypothetical protein PHMEG_00041237 [Phytophthora megakarya]|uniref:DDE Tnp4 domain-containing protein n=1 Tax=Phytophthora megakarya TaxID=4795 RepID=A0A225UC00_9STRA|nr:hypothetical protein PHMEG_00041237 [Phytophthora megakarya]
MPKMSERQRFLREILDVLAVATLEEEDGEDLNLSCEQLLSSELDDISYLLLLVQSHRYLTDRVRLPKPTEFLADTQSCVFNKPTYQQAPPWFQLFVALDRFGNNGTGASLNRSRRLWAIGKGTVDAYTNRVVKALNQLAAQYVRWPNAAQRRRTSRELGRLGFRGCVGFIDGATVPLAQKPAKDGECFFDRKQRYSLNAQVVCDNRRRVISFLSAPARTAQYTRIANRLAL